MLELLYFILCSYGLTAILCYSSILAPVRPKHKFFRCPQCMGFWVGAFLWALNKYTTLFTYEYTLFNALLLACLSSGTAYALNMLVDDNGLKIGRE